MPAPVAPLQALCFCCNNEPWILDTNGGTIGWWRIVLRIVTLPETNMAPENGLLEYFLVSWIGARHIFRGELLVSGFRE